MVLGINSVTNMVAMRFFLCKNTEAYKARPMVAFSKGKGMVVTSIFNSFFAKKKHMSKLNHHWMEALFSYVRFILLELGED